MSYYDNIKDSVKEDSDSGSGPSFDSLKEAAQETSEEEQQGDDTEIEVLEEGLDPQPTGKTQTEKKREQRQKPGSKDLGQNSAGNQAAGTGSTSGSARNETSPAMNSGSSGVEEKLDRIIEQNDRLIEILERMA